MRKYYSLYGQLLSKQRLYEAFRHVKRNKGAAGIDGQSLSAFEANLEVELSCLLLELKEKRYRAQPVRRVAIAKDSAGWRRVSGRKNAESDLRRHCRRKPEAPA